ncbi:MAG: VOC family protein [Bryobacteraceae bacterium]
MSHSTAYILVCCVFAIVNMTAQTPPAPEPLAHFHHLHLNATDPQAGIDFYTKHFDAEKAKFAGAMDAVWTQKSWLLFTKVNTPPVSEITSTIWHFGWGAEDMKQEYQRQLDMGTKFETPITDISDIGGGNAQGVFFYAYVQGPDNALIELNTARHHHFGHLHLLSEDPVAAGEWYSKHFGISNVRYQKAKRVYKGVEIAPSASFMIDNVNVIIFPVEYARDSMPKLWAGRKTFESTKGHVVDHIGLSVENLEASLARLKEEQVTITDPPRSVLGGKVKFAFIEGPDKMRIEVIEGVPMAVPH